jgi:hypothetical protein
MPTLGDIIGGLALAVIVIALPWLAWGLGGSL